MSIQDILSLPESDRLEMIDQIWDSIETKNIDLTSAQKTELDRRIAMDDEGKMKWHRLEEVKSILNNRT